MPEPMKRRLSAIMFSDMVGFTALMQEDEETAHTLRDRYRQVLVSRVTGHGGRIHQYYGDGALSTFDSAVEAVLCAVQMQLELAGEPRVPVRIGVHTGDIVHDADGVYGDGVNVAARVEGLAPPGGVLISGKVFDEVKNHASISAVPFGPVRLKNVAHGVEIFAVSNAGLPLPDREELLALTGAGGAKTEALAGREAAEPRSPQGAGEAFLRAVKERSLVPWAVAYLAAAGILLALVRFLVRFLAWPSGVVDGADLLAFVGLLVTLVVSWYHGERGPQRVRREEVVVIVALVVAGLGALSLIGSGKLAGPLEVGRVAVDPGADRRPSVAVLPFDNISPDPDDAYFAHGVQEDITTALSRVRMIRVPGRVSVARFSEERPGNREIAAALGGVDYLVEGSARVAGTTVRITVALIDVRTDERVWSEVYDRDFIVAELIAVQADVAKEVAAELQALITPEDSARMVSVPTALSDAWVLWQKARYHWNLRTEADVRRARDDFQAAIDLDPTFAEAWAGLADVFLVLANWGWMDHEAAFHSGRAAAGRALELDSLMAGAHASMAGLHLWSTRDWASSERHFRRAIELDPEHSYAHYWFSVLLGVLGRHDEARAEATLAWEIEPLAPQVAYGVVRSHFLARDYGRARVEAVRARALHPGYGNLRSVLCNTLIAAGSYDEAEAACLSPSGTDDPYALNGAILRAHQGRRDEALTRLEAARRARGDRAPQPVLEAMVHAALGDGDEALALLQTAMDGGYPHVEYLSNHPFFDPLRSDPRYRELVERLALPLRS